MMIPSLHNITPVSLGPSRQRCVVINIAVLQITVSLIHGQYKEPYTSGLSPHLPGLCIVPNRFYSDCYWPTWRTRNHQLFKHSSEGISLRYSVPLCKSMSNKFSWPLIMHFSRLYGIFVAQAYVYALSSSSDPRYLKISVACITLSLILSSHCSLH